MTPLARERLEDRMAELNRLAAMLDLIALGTERMGTNSNIEAAIDGAADFLRYIRNELGEIGTPALAPEIRS